MQFVNCCLGIYHCHTNANIHKVKYNLDNFFIQNVYVVKKNKNIKYTYVNII